MFFETAVLWGIYDDEKEDDANKLPITNRHPRVIVWNQTTKAEGDERGRQFKVPRPL
jgi:hypothetical protein